MLLLNEALVYCTRLKGRQKEVVPWQTNAQSAVTNTRTTVRAIAAAMRRFLYTILYHFSYQKQSRYLSRLLLGLQNKKPHCLDKLRDLYIMTVNIKIAFFFLYR